jgi:hypothetical protein
VFANEASKRFMPIPKSLISVYCDSSDEEDRDGNDDGDTNRTKGFPSSGKTKARKLDAAPKVTTPRRPTSFLSRWGSFPIKKSQGSSQNKKNKEELPCTATVFQRKRGITLTQCGNSSEEEEEEDATIQGKGQLKKTKARKYSLLSIVYLKSDV